jgi:hypothetical protein
MTWFLGDLFKDNAYVAAKKAGVLGKAHIEKMKGFLHGIVPMSAAFEQKWVKNLHPNNVKTSTSKMDLAEQLMADIERFKNQSKADRLVIIWAASTEVYTEPQPVHDTLETLEAGLKNNSPDISPSMIYAYAALNLGVPFANGAPHVTADIPALTNLALTKKIPICGKDFKSGQTFMKTLLAPGIKAKMLGLTGWFSTNILGNRDGEVLDDPDNFKSKVVTKASVLEHIIQPDQYPELYNGYYHKVRINYYPPRGDAKESWGTPASACFNTATICSTMNRFCFTAKYPPSGIRFCRKLTLKVDQKKPGPLTRATGDAREGNKKRSRPERAVRYRIVSGQEAKLTAQTHFPVQSTRTSASLQVSFPRRCLRTAW